MDRSRCLSINKLARDNPSDVFLKQDRIARFAPEKQFSTTFRHCEPKLKRIEKVDLHQLLRHSIVLVLLCAALTALVLLLIGILLDHRPCLTAGCILGLVCFGVMLHGCLRHRSIPSSTTPVLLSAAYMYPVGNLSLGRSHRDNAAATAMATATLLPKAIQPRSSLMASSLEIAMLARLQPDLSITFPAGVPMISSRAITGGSLFPDDPMIMPPSSFYIRQMSDSVVHTKPSGTGVDRSSGPALVPEFRGQFSCPARTGGQVMKPHVYENLLPYGGWNVSKPEAPLTHRPPKVERNPETAKLQTDARACSKHSQSALNFQNHGTQSTIRTPQPGSADFYKPPVFPVPEHVSTSDSCRKSLAENNSDQICRANPAALAETQPGTTHTQVRVVSPVEKHIRTPRSMLEDVQNPLLDPSLSSGLLRLLSDSSVVTGEEVRQGRRHTRDRDGVFGPKVWRAWRSWVD